jgi:hypothetical protein
MKKILVILALSLVTAAASFAAPCSGQSFAALSGGSCTVTSGSDVFTFSNFQNFQQTATGLLPLTASDLVAVELTGASMVGLGWSYKGGQWNISSSGNQDKGYSFRLDYQVTGPNANFVFSSGTLGYQNLSMNDASSANDPYWSATKQFFPPGQAGQFQSISLQRFTPGSGLNGSNTQALSQLLNSIVLSDQVNFYQYSDGTGTAGVTTFDYVYNSLGYQDNTIPEPMTFGMLGAGLLAFGLLRRKLS